MSEFAIINPRRRRRGGSKRRKRSRSRSRARARHNPGNPFRARRRRRSARRNPGFRGPSFGDLNLTAVGWGVAGAVGVEVGGAAATKLLPPDMQGSTPVRLGLKVALVIAGSMLAKRFVGSAAAKAMALGGGISIGLEAVRTYVLPNVPGLSDVMQDYLLSDDSGLQGYLDPSLSAGGRGAGGGDVAQFSPQWGG